MLKNYEQSCVTLSAQQMQEIKDETIHEHEGATGCMISSDCGQTICETPFDTVFACITSRCFIIDCA